MANFEVSEIYNNEIGKLEPTTPGHADYFNEIFQKLINNDAFIKKVAEQQLALMQSHINNTTDPHQEVFQTYYQQLIAYTDKAVADLINGAPETADTLRELADLIDENKDVATALDEAIGKKANQTELDQALESISSLNTALTTHKTSGDHDSRYCTKTEYNALNETFTQEILTLNSALENKILKVEKTYLSPQIQIGANTYNAYTYSDFKDVKSGYTLLSTNVEVDKDLVFTGFHYLSDSNLRVSFFNAYGEAQTVAITVIRQIWLKNS